MIPKTPIYTIFLTLAVCLIWLASAFVLVCSASEQGNAPSEKSKETLITHYEFGRMEVNGKLHKLAYLLISTDGTVSSWPVVSHYIEFADVENHIDANTKVLIIGTGDRGGVIVPKETREQIKARGIELHYLKTAPAVELFNKLPKDNLVGLFHLNC